MEGTKYVNLKAHPLRIQKEHGTLVAAIVMRLNGCSLEYALALLTGRYQNV